MSEFIVADTELGKVRGVKVTSALDTEYNSFLGIRYATPPIDNLRFKVSFSISADIFASMIELFI